MNRYMTLVYRLPEGFDPATITNHEHMVAASWSHVMDERNRLSAEKAELVATVERCYKMLLSEPDTKGALFKTENILRELLADAKVVA